MIVEPTFANGDGAGVDGVGNSRGIADWIERRRIVRMNASSPEHESRIRFGDGARPRGRLDRLADANNGARAFIAGPSDDVVAIDVERRIGEMRVAVDECAHGVS